MEIISYEKLLKDKERTWEEKFFPTYTYTHKQNKQNMEGMIV